MKCFNCCAQFDNVSGVCPSCGAINGDGGQSNVLPQTEVPIDYEAPIAEVTNDTPQQDVVVEEAVKADAALDNHANDTVDEVNEVVNNQAATPAPVQNNAPVNAQPNTNPQVDNILNMINSMPVAPAPMPAYAMPAAQQKVKKPINKTLVTVCVVAVAVLLSAIVAIMFFVNKGKAAEDPVFYQTDKGFYYCVDGREVESIRISKKYVGNNYIMSANKKYVIYQECEYSDAGSLSIVGDLYAYRVDGKENKPIKLEKEIERVYFATGDIDKVYYQKNGNFYYADIDGNSTKIESNCEVYDFYYYYHFKVEAPKNILLRSSKCNDDGSFAIMIYDVKRDEVIELENDIKDYYFYQPSNFDSFCYIDVDSELHYVTADGQETDIDNEVSEAKMVDDKVYYTKLTGQHPNAADVLSSERRNGNDYTYNQAVQNIYDELKDYNYVDVYEYSNGSSSLLLENQIVDGFYMISETFVLNEETYYGIRFSTIDISKIDKVDAIDAAVEYDFTEHFNSECVTPYICKDAQLIKIETKDNYSIDSVSYDINSDCFRIETKEFLTPEESELRDPKEIHYSLPRSASSWDEAEEIEETLFDANGVKLEVYHDFKNDTFDLVIDGEEIDDVKGYNYMSGTKGEFKIFTDYSDKNETATLYIYKNGKLTKIADDIYVGTSPILAFEERNNKYYAITDADENGVGTLTVFSNGKSQEIADDVEWFSNRNQCDFN